jgi:hypothetical protein
MKISTPNFDKHSFSPLQKQAPKEKVVPPLKSIGTLVKKQSPFAELLNFGQIWG